jgi:hypothetical protein
VIARLLCGEPVPSAGGLDELLALVRPVAAPAERAILGGFAATAPAWAFAAGYGAALRALVPGVPERASLCATEEGGAHPRAIQTKLEAGVVRGKKRFATLATRADVLLVVASVGADSAGLNRLKLVRVDARGRGVKITAMPPYPVAPEIEHAEVELDGAPAAKVYDGDGYDRYLKPFRTIEDAHVLCAIVAHVLRAARVGGWPEAARERLVAVLGAARAAAEADPSAPATHVALAGVQSLARTVMDELEPRWDEIAEPWRGEWRRDRALLEIAGKAREARREAAWRALSGSR